MILVDSSGWVEYLADSPRADAYASAIEDTARLLVPTICVLEVYEHALRTRGEDAALEAAGAMRQGQVVDLDIALTLAAAELGLEAGLPLADSIILATARAYGAVLWTQDAHFEGMNGVRYLRA